MFRWSLRGREVILGFGVLATAAAGGCRDVQNGRLDDLSVGRRPAQTRAAASDSSTMIPRAATARSIFLITIDTLQADHLGCYGYPRDTSPAIDTIARTGIRFEQAMAQWPKTTPSFASMFTGLYPHSTGVERACGLVIDDRFTMLAERLRDAGYRTIGVTWNPNLGREFGFGQGFDVYLEMDRDPPRPAGLERVSGPKWLHGLNDFALWELSKTPAEQPVFLWVHYINPHAPYLPHNRFKDKFVDDPLFDGSHTARFLSREEDVEFGNIGGINSHVRLGNETRVAYYVSQYDAAIRTADLAIGRLLGRIGATGRLEDSLVIITADHGEGLGKHDLYFDHGPLPYDDCLHVPLILKVPGIAGGRTVPEPVALIDLAPTILDWAGLVSDSSLEGQSLLARIASDEPVDTLVFSGAGYAGDYQRIVRYGRWKLIFVPSPSDRELMTGAEFELYDLEADPHENENLAERRPDLVDALKRPLMAWIEAGRARAAEPARAPGELEPETEQQLRELGYIRSSR